ncbi:MAG: UDP-3-O-(3-hydroxymyristoyl)glucosamine N-acyltransferase, partial [Candidatus Heimdallarchaeota archaeon]|nr:UDP-3-O-(3-hydroxymyristoyl)glucosamine N-acyltransferase [Candidatus Heimdallarchaeota archaeon]
NLIQIAHNCIVNEHTVIAAQTGLSGSTEIGRNVTIGGQAGFNGHIKIGDNSIIAAQSGVTKDVKPKEILFGTPAYPIMERKKIEVSIKHLPESIKRIKQLESEVLELKKLLGKDQKGND